MKKFWKPSSQAQAAETVGAFFAGLGQCLRALRWKPAYLPLTVLAAGAVGAGLRLWLLSGRDSGGLIAAGHPAGILLTILSLGVLALLVLTTAPLVQGTKYRFNFPASRIRFAGTAAGALGILVASIQQLISSGDGLAAAAAVLGIIGSGVLGYIALHHLQGRQPSLFLHGYLCVYLMVHLICQYRIWSSEPQIQTYCYPLLATVCVMLACYHSATFDGDWGTRRAYTVTHLLAAFFCCLSVVGDYMPLFYLGIGAWMFCDQCSLVPISRDYLREHKR